MTLILPLNLLFFMKVAFLLVFEYFQIKLCFICKIMMNITCLNYCMKSATQKFPGEVKLLFFLGGLPLFSLAFLLILHTVICKIVYSLRSVKQ